MRTKPLWKQTRPPHDPSLCSRWVEQVEEHLYGAPEMQNELLKAWGFHPYKRKDLRKKPLRDKMLVTSLRARVLEGEILSLRMRGLSFRQIATRFGISHVAVWKRYWFAMTESAREESYRMNCLRDVRWLVEGWVKTSTQDAPNMSLNGVKK